MIRVSTDKTFRNHIPDVLLIVNKYIWIKIHGQFLNQNILDIIVIKTTLRK